MVSNSQLTVYSSWNVFVSVDIGEKIFLHPQRLLTAFEESLGQQVKSAQSTAACLNFTGSPAETDKHSPSVHP